MLGPLTVTASISDLVGSSMQRNIVILTVINWFSLSTKLHRWIRASIYFLDSLYNYLWKSYANDDCCESLRKSVGIHSHWWSNGYHSKITHWVVLLSLGLVSEWIIRGHTIGQGFERSPLFDKFDQIFIKLPRNCFGCMLILIFFLPRGIPLIVTETHGLTTGVGGQRTPFNWQLYTMGSINE